MKRCPGRRDISEFADGYCTMANMIKSVLGKVVNIAGKGENAI